MPTAASSQPVNASAIHDSRLLARLEQVAAHTPHAIAIIEESGRTLSYAVLVERIARITQVLCNHGVQRGDRVLFAVRPSETAVATIIALTELGAVLVAAQLGVGDELFAAQMRTVEPQWVIAETVLVVAMRNRAIRTLLRQRGSVLPSFGPLSEARVITIGRWLPLTGAANRLETLERSAMAPSCAPLDIPTAEDDDLLIVFTSGTTAQPKAVVHTRASLFATLAAVSTHLPIIPGNRVFARDLHLIVPALLAGATAVVPRTLELAPRALLSMVETHRITHLFEVTAHLERLIAYLEVSGRRLPAFVQDILVGAAPVRQAFFQRLSHCIGTDTRAWCVYGMTEMLPVAAIELRDKLAFDGDGDIVGKPVDGVVARINEHGELVVTGTHRFNRYLGSAPVAEHRTGDFASMDAQGRIVLQGRARDMIIRGAHNIYPELHEPIVEQIDGVARAAMIGVFDDTHQDERVILVVEPTRNPGSMNAEQALRTRVARALRTTHRIDDAALPDDIVIATIPLSGRSSKVDKESLRRTLARRAR